MSLSITKLRSDLFNQVEHALQGDNVEFVHKGVVFRIVPETKPMKLAKLKGQQVMAGGAETLDNESLLKEMEAEWEKDWASL